MELYVWQKPEALAENEIAGSWFGGWVVAVLDREFGVTVRLLLAQGYKQRSLI